jgi:hypothetical protein
MTASGCRRYTDRPKKIRWRLGGENYKLNESGEMVVIRKEEEKNVGLSFPVFI